VTGPPLTNVNDFRAILVMPDGCIGRPEALAAKHAGASH
jgi:hypothetical protein